MNNYRRIKLNASKSSWTDIGFNVSSNEMIAIFVSGKIKICNSCGKGGEMGVILILKTEIGFFITDIMKKCHQKNFNLKILSGKINLLFQ